MSHKPKRQPGSAFETLTPGQQRAWLAYMRVQLRLTYEMNRQLQADSNLSLPDYDVLNALQAPNELRSPVLTGDLNGCRNLQQQGMHGITEFGRGNRKKLIARLNLLLQLGNSSAKLRLIPRETALRARVSTQIQLPPGSSY